MATKGRNWPTEMQSKLKRLPPDKLNEFGDLVLGSERIRFMQKIDVLSDVKSFKDNLDNRHSSLKNLQLSIKHRCEGNKFFQTKNYKKALHLYNKALKFAPGKADSSLALCHGNKSAALFHMEKFEACLSHIMMAFEEGFPVENYSKLFIRKICCLYELSKVNDATQVINEAETFISENEKDLKKKESLLKEINELKKKTLDIRDYNQTAENAVEIPEVSYGSNMIVTQASGAIRLENNLEKGRHLIACQNIKKGDVLIVEKPYAAVLLPEHYDSHCNHCLAVLDFALPCHQCTEVLYCSKRCKDEAWKLYHSRECRFLPFLHSVGVAHLSMRIVEKAGLQYLLDFKHELQELEEKFPERVKGISSSGLYERRYLSVYDLMPHAEDIHVEDRFMYSMTAYALLQLLILSGWFTDNIDLNLKNMELTDNKDIVHFLTPEQEYIGSLLDRHILQLVCNAHAITELQVSDTDFKNVDVTSQTRVATAIYPTASLMNHSCDPTIISSFHGNILIVKATKDVHKGEEIFNCYGPHFQRMDVEERQEILRDQYFFECSCHACRLQLRSSSSMSKYCCIHCGNEITLCEDCILCGNCNLTIDKKEYLDKESEGKQLFLEALDLLEKHHVREAISELKNCYDIRKKIMSKKNKDLAETQDCLARCCSIVGEYDLACTYLEESIKFAEHTFGDNSVEYGNELQKYSEVLVNAGHFGKASTCVDKALKIFHLQYGIYHKTYRELKELQRHLQMHLMK